MFVLVVAAVNSFSSSLASYPFRLRLEDVVGIHPTIFRTYDHYTDIQVHTTAPVRYACSETGHVLVAHPIGDDEDDGALPLTKYVESKGVDDLCLVDGVRLFSTARPCFRCFVTGRASSEALALRVQDTCIWLLVSSCFDLVECNECTSIISRCEFTDIQQGFIRLLLRRDDFQA